MMEQPQEEQEEEEQSWFPWAVMLQPHSQRRKRTERKRRTEKPLALDGSCCHRTLPTNTHTESMLLVHLSDLNIKHHLVLFSN